jgi:hypothetical protein
MKTVINVYTKYIKPENYDIGMILTPGLGDFIRGTITLLKLSKEMGFNVLVDLRYNPVSKFLKTQDIDKLYLEKVDENLNDLKFFIYLNKLKNYIIESFKNNDIITLHTNAIIKSNTTENFYNINTKNDSLTEDEKNYIKNIFTPNDELKNYIDEKMINIPKNYEIIHFRIGDEYSFQSNNIPENNLVKFEELFKNNYNENTILLSDNKFFKNYIKSKYNVHIIDNDIEHIGNLNNDINNIINNKYIWGSPDLYIKFLDNFKMDAFGEGEYKIIDNRNIIAYFGCRYHNIKFNDNYTEFVSIRQDDSCIVNGKLKIIDSIDKNNNLDGIKGSLLDFFIQSNSKKIKSISVYNWISGFIYWNSLIYDIPIEVKLNIFGETQNVI